MVFISVYNGDKFFLKAFSVNILEIWYSDTKMILLSKNCECMKIRSSKNIEFYPIVSWLRIMHDTERL